MICAGAAFPHSTFIHTHTHTHITCFKQNCPIFSWGTQKKKEEEEERERKQTTF